MQNGCPKCWRTCRATAVNTIYLVHGRRPQISLPPSTIWFLFFILHYFCFEEMKIVIANIAYCNQNKCIFLSTQNDTVSEKFRYGERRVPLVVCWLHECHCCGTIRTVARGRNNEMPKRFQVPPSQCLADKTLLQQQAIAVIVEDWTDVEEWAQQLACFMENLTLQQAAGNRLLTACQIVVRMRASPLLLPLFNFIYTLALSSALPFGIISFLWFIVCTYSCILLLKASLLLSKPFLPACRRLFHLTWLRSSRFISLFMSLLVRCWFFGAIYCCLLLLLLLIAASTSVFVCAFVVLISQTVIIFKLFPVEYLIEIHAWSRPKLLLLSIAYCCCGCGCGCLSYCCCCRFSCNYCRCIRVLATFCCQLALFYCQCYCCVAIDRLWPAALYICTCICILIVVVAFALLKKSVHCGLVGL